VLQKLLKPWAKHSEFKISIIIPCYFFLGNNIALKADLLGAMLAIQLAVIRGRTSLWLESDSQLVVEAFQNPSMVPWCIKGKMEVLPGCVIS